MQRTRQPLCILFNGRLYACADALGRIDGNTVPGMDACPFNMLHNTRNQNILSVAYRIHLNLLALKIFVHQDRMILRYPVNDAYKFFHVFIINRNLHPLSAQHIGRTDQHRIAQTVRRRLCLPGSIDCISLRARDTAFLQNAVKQLPVLCRVHILCRSSQNRHSHLH